MSTATMTAVLPAQVWELTLGELRLQMTKATFNTHLNDATFVQYRDGAFVVAVRSEAARQWLAARLQETVERTLSAIAGHPTAVTWQVLGDETAVPTNGHPIQLPPPPEDPDPRPLRPAEGYGGHLTTEDRQALLEKIQARERANGKSDAPELARADQIGKRGPKFHVPSRPRKNGRGDQAHIDVVERDPMKAHVETPHYAKRFWQPLLGLNAFALWELLRSYYFFVKYYDAEQPTVSLLCDTLGWKDRRTMIGREATETTPGYDGAVQVLERYGILRHQTTGEGPQTVHHFRQVLDDLPLLTPKQVAQLSKAKQIEHETFLRHYDFDYDTWLQIGADSNVQEAAAKRVL